MLVELVRTTTPDGMRLDGVLHAPQSVASIPPVDLAIALHGVGSNFYAASVIEALVEPLTQLGIALLRVNTRGHDNISTATLTNGRRWQGAAFEIVDECRHDILGWLAWAKERGYRRVALVGHSLGAIKALYAAAHEALPDVACIVAISPPRLSYSQFRQGTEKDRFFAALATAEGYFQQRHPETLFQAKFPFPIFITAAGYVDKYGPRERYNFLKFIERVPCRVLFVYGSVELKHSPSPFAGVTEALSSLPSIQDRMRVVTIAGADHIYSGQHSALGGVMTEWLGSALAD